MRYLFATAGLIAIAQSTTVSAQVAPERPRIIADGYGEVKTMPDVATIGFTLRGEGTTSDEAVKAMVAMGTKITAMLRTVDRTIEPKSDDVSVGPVKGSACKDRDYDSPDQLSKGACAVVGYIATQAITIRTSNIQDSGTMVGLAGRGGAYDATIKSFDLSDPRPPKQQAIAAAITDAQSKAAAVAAGTHVSLGPILTASTAGRIDTFSSQEVKLQGATRTEDLVNSLPQSFAPPVAVSVVPQPITTSANVTVTYAIQ